MKVLEKASQLQPDNPHPKYSRANVLIKLGRAEEALQQLRIVRDYVPRESSVRFLMGKVCKQLNRTDEAMRHFLTALDLNPKDANQIKAQLDKLDSPVDHDDNGL